MQKQPSQITIYKRGTRYFADVRGCFGGGYSGCHAGESPEDAALFVLREEGRYIKSNPMGGDIFAPTEVREAIQAAKL